jgi:hypothetical protein
LIDTALRGTRVRESPAIPISEEALFPTILTSTERLDYWARVSTRLVLSDDPGEEDVGERAREVSTFRGAITERNGFNCRPRDERCITWKVGVLRIRESASRRLFANFVADCGLRLEERSGATRCRCSMTASSRWSATPRS